MNDLIVFAQLVGVAYFMSVGFGMIVAQGRGVIQTPEAGPPGIGSYRS